ncbi:hypothetical protein TNCV_167401 [Trichonephila clavipes]|nr:hypothetical protein TNCV_167401 [Trichonephila clavipes]
MVNSPNIAASAKTVLQFVEDCLAKNKIVLDPALRLFNHSNENVTIGVRSGIECQQQERWSPVQTLLEKLTEMKIGLDRQHECQHGQK